MGRHSPTPKETRQILRFWAVVVVVVIVTTLAAFHVLRYVVAGFWILVFISAWAALIWHGFFSEKNKKK